MNDSPARQRPDVDSGDPATASAAAIRPGQRLIIMMLLAAAALDLTRCGLVLATARHLAPAAELTATGLTAATLSAWTARGCRGGRRWATWGAVLIGAASAPQAAANGFHAPYAIPDTATAALGVLLTVAVLATAGHAGQPGHDTEIPCRHVRSDGGDDAAIAPRNLRSWLVWPAWHSALSSAIGGPAGPDGCGCGCAAAWRCCGSSRAVGSGTRAVRRGCSQPQARSAKCCEATWPCRPPRTSPTPWGR
jgi:hypothetical protein